MHIYTLCPKTPAHPTFPLKLLMGNVLPIATVTASTLLDFYFICSMAKRMITFSHKKMLRSELILEYLDLDHNLSFQKYWMRLHHYRECSPTASQLKDGEFISLNLTLALGMMTLGSCTAAPDHSIPPEKSQYI